MNLQNLTILRDTLLNLPPEVHLDMDNGRMPHPCGTAACIAGVCHIINNPGPTLHTYSFPWPMVQEVALEWLGLPARVKFTNAMAHPLFDFTLAPADCTPQQAAQAVQNVMDNQSPWN